MFLLINALLVTAASIVALYLLRLYKYRIFALSIPIAFSLIWGALSAQDPSSWQDLGAHTLASVVIAPVCVWIFFRRQLTRKKDSAT